MSQFTLYSHESGPNGWKVALVMKSLGLVYDTIFLNFERQEHKKADFLKINPNGRIPALVDNSENDSTLRESGAPEQDNSDKCFTLWESGAIIQYLVESYDKDHLISFKDKKDQMKAIQWLFFQASGQGPYFGQAVYSKKSGQDFNMTAIKHYEDEVKRVVSVLDKELEDREWLVGDKISFADISFYPWNAALETHIFPGEDFLDNFAPNVARWMERMALQDSFKEVLQEQDIAIARLLNGSGNAIDDNADDKNEDSAAAAAAEVKHSALAVSS